MTRAPTPAAIDPALAALGRRSPTLGRALRAAPSPRRLYHYTSAASLVAILAGDPIDPQGRRSPALRATHLRFMNDRSELKLATALIGDALMRRARTAAPRPVRARLEAVRAALDGLSNEPWIWAVSWSELGNQLSQWRAYAGGVGGFSLGVPLQRLSRRAAEQDFVLARCIYPDRLQRRIAVELAESVARDGAGRDAGRGARAHAASARALAEDLMLAGALMKHPGFASATCT